MGPRRFALALAAAVALGSAPIRARIPARSRL
jgi:hypothetical protein